MVTELRRPDLLSTDIPMLVLAAMTIVSVAAWVVAHWLKGRIAKGWQRRGFLAVQAIAGTTAIWSLFQFGARFVVLSTGWSLWFTALITATAVEVTVALYEFERSMISRFAGRMLLGLRITLILLLAVMLAQPVLQWEKHTDITRYVAVLLDDSASMHIADRALTSSEKLKLASLFDIRAACNRPRLDLVPASVAAIREKLVRECASLQAVPEADTSSFEALLKKQGAVLGKLLQDTIRTLNSDYTTLGKAPPAGKSASGRTEQDLEDVRGRLKKTVIPRLAEAAWIVSGKTGGGAKERRQSLLRALNTAGDELVQILRILPLAIAKSDEVFYRGLGPVDQKAIEDIASRTRAAIAHDVLASSNAGSKSILDRLKSKYSVKFVRFASEPVTTDLDEWLKDVGKYVPPVSPADGPGGENNLAGTNIKDFQKSTDIGAALEKIAREATPDSLAGVLVLTDGRHNGRMLPEAAARQVGSLGAPVCTVVIGSRETPKDAAVLDVVAPVSVYLGDKVNLQVLMRFDALRGRKAIVRLLMGGQSVDETTVDVPDDKFRTSVSMGHTPPAVGIYDYEVEIEPIEDEPLKENNKWRVRVAASDNRINVLLVDGLPRWDFRYLRNLLYARDRAVQLQYVLLEPDGLDGSRPPAMVYASAARKFGDAEATALPGTREDWMRFDAIIIGDVSPSSIDAATLDTIKHCVSERGALLVVIAGPRFMPHWYSSAVMRELLPVRYAQGETSCYAGQESFYGIRLAAEGNTHPIMQQGGSAQESRQIWESFPPLMWRHAVTGVKEGASVLAYAVPGTMLASDVPDKLQKENPLVVVQQYGLGRVAYLNFDETWRLRYRKGDVHHHKFWGQVIRWGVGDKLRSGTVHVRIGTDRLTYPVTAPIKVDARVLDMEFKAVTDEAVYVNVFRDNQSVMRKQLHYRQNSCGMYETTLPAMPEAGIYRAVLESEKVSGVLAAENALEVSTEFVVAPPVNTVEFAELSTDLETAGKMAGASGGMVAGPEGAEKVLEVFGPGSRTLSEIRELTLWDTWPLLALMILTVTAEWLLRRKKGMA